MPEYQAFLNFSISSMLSSSHRLTPPFVVSERVLDATEVAISVIGGLSRNDQYENQNDEGVNDCYMEKLCFG